ncbi:MAG: S-adenosylmethionine:tRNA ribosyltransferase-isomerase [Bacteroidetes bacterium]|nr:S-adenosylmethionine:tRNA ribosyltransferase-isomerase [Bacteroidota bacterium]
MTEEHEQPVTPRSDPETDPRLIRIEEYNYPLPLERIAFFPLEQRDQSKLLIYRIGDQPFHDAFSNLAQHLPPAAALVLNDTKVIYARLLFTKPSGATIEIFCLNPELPSAEIQTAFQLSSPVVWKCLVGNARRWKDGRLQKSHQTDGQDWMLTAERVENQQTESMPSREGNQVLIRFSWEPAHLSFSQVIEVFGVVPLPPYIHRAPEEEDKLRYQTIYASHDGSVAAPTAGLHFTPAVFESLKNRQIHHAFLTLHVGAGTFKPVTSERVGDHGMHQEPFEISKELLGFLESSAHKKLVAVGTTTVRTLESLYWIGARLLTGVDPDEAVVIDQWIPYGPLKYQVFSRAEILNALQNMVKMRYPDPIRGYTRLLIAPGYTFHMTDGMITNFHQPKSTLLLLIAAFLGSDWGKAYQYALDHHFRFLSYGDSCLFLPAT